MSMFNEFERPKKLKDPEVRQAEELQRTKKKARGWRKSKNTSVSVNKVTTMLTIAGILASLIVLAITAYGVYFGIQLYLNG